MNDRLPIPVSHARHAVTTSLGEITLALTTLRSVGAPDAVVAQVAELLASAEGPARARSLAGWFIMGCSSTRTSLGAQTEGCAGSPTSHGEAAWRA